MLISPDERKNLILTLGTHRKTRRLSPVEAAQIIDKAISGGMSREDVASLCLVSVDMVMKIRKLVTLTPGVRHMIEWGGGPSTVSPSVGTEIARLVDSSHQEQLCALSLQWKLIKREVLAIIDFVNRLGLSVDNAVERVVSQRTVKKQLYVVVGALLDLELTRALDNLPQNQRNDLLNRAVKRLYAGTREWGSSLGASRFTLTGDRVFADFIGRLPEGAEQTITRLLKSGLEFHAGV